MLVILHHPGDLVVAALAADWATRAPGLPRAFVTAADFVNGVEWNYHHPRHIDDTVLLPNSPLGWFGTDEISVVLNRLQWLEAPPFPDERDRSYAASELFAFALAWLSSLRCPVINPASPLGTSGARLTLNEILRAATSAGLAARRTRMVCAPKPRTATWDVHVAPTRRFEPLGPLVDNVVPLGPVPAVLLEPLSESHDVQIVGDAVLGAPDPALVAPLQRFTSQLNLRLAEVTVGWGQQQDSWVVADATGFPQSLRPDAVRVLSDQLMATGVRA